MIAITIFAVAFPRRASFNFPDSSTRPKLPRRVRRLISSLAPRPTFMSRIGGRPFGAVGWTQGREAARFHLVGRYRLSG